MKIISSFVALVCILFTWGMQPVCAMNLYTYDLDSMAYMSSEIVEGNLVRHYQGPTNIDFVDFKVTSVYKGKFMPGQTVVITATDFFCKSADDSFKTSPFIKTKPLDQGDHLFLFLVRAKSEFLYHIPEDAEIFWPVPSGVKLVQNDQVLGFTQFSNPGPYIAISPAVNPKLQFPSVAAFREQIEQSILTADTLKPLLTSPPAMADIPRLLALVNARESDQTGIFERNDITETACAKIAALHVYPVLTVLLSRHWDRSMSPIIRGFWTPGGRDYLLRQAANRNLTQAQRIQFAQILSGAGEYNDTSYFKDIPPSSKPINGNYYKRIASVALANQDNEEFSRMLIDALGKFTENLEGTGGSDARAKLPEDLRNALPFLTQLYQATSSEDIKYRIESILCFADPKAFRALHALGDPILSLLTLRSEPIYPFHGGKGVFYDYEAKLLTGSAEELTSSAAFLNLATRKEDLFPTANLEMGRGDNNIILPASFPAGRYRVRLQFYRGGQLISASHSSVVDL